MTADRPLAEVQAEFDAAIQRLVSSGSNLAQGLGQVRDRTFLAWDDDGGEGYASAVVYTIPTGGDYRLIVGGSLSALGRGTFGGYALRVGRNAGEEPTGAPFVQREQATTALAPVIELARGSLTPARPRTTLRLAGVEAGQTIYVSVAPTTI
jgi:hypothetical protein